MSKKRIGIYLGLNSIGGVAVESKKIVAASRYDLASVEEEAKVESLSEEIRWQALVNKILRELGSEERNVYVSLADKDFIFRSLEMPLMDKKNVGSSLVFEIEKYIPFKIDELMWDYSFIRYPKEKKINISFVGIRESNILKVNEMFSHLNLNPIILEPSSLSLVKMLKASKKFSQVKNFSILDISEAEAYLTFFHEDLPVFSQYIAITKKGESFDLDKFVESVRFAYQYFKREFRAYELEKFITITTRKEDTINALLKDELQIEVESASPYELANAPDIDMETLKGFGVTNIESTYKFRPSLRKTEEYVEEKLVASEEPLRIWLLLGLIGAAALIALGVSIFFGSEVTGLQYKLDQADKAFERPKELRGLPAAQIEVKLKEKEDQLAKLENLGSNPVIAPSLEKIAELRPKGLWFEGVDVDCRDKKYSLSITGYIFSGDAYNERSGVDAYIASLKKDDDVKAVFSSIEMVSIERRTIGEYTVTYFVLRLN